ncbi:hypothetical protein BD94_1996 [Elizabethkingia anophelis NUHP1]|uniref:Uncharacterized protein n=1 Tax=Elizabethkingia anophelis NUHP1 TaxID=1338011 RepID=A0A077EDY2_9FLAO|nr:hypothetical protein BD94_1996 [Elizabethkingia anophelis NUHP1]KMU65046.1 hypothetical protein EZBTHKR_0530 [Elizabethkingia anophelis]
MCQDVIIPEEYNLIIGVFSLYFSPIRKKQNRSSEKYLINKRR